MMTSRSEYRLLNRQDNADLRLTPVGRRIGLVSETQYQTVLEKYELVQQETARLEHVHVPPTEALNAMLEDRGTAGVTTGVSLADLIRRPQISYESTAPFDPERKALLSAVVNEVEIGLKYEGYIKRQLRQVEEFSRMESRPIPMDMDYGAIVNLRREAREKLAKIRPANFGQAGRISGVSPADISALMVWLEARHG